jgi:hypothetical protein
MTDVQLSRRLRIVNNLIQNSEDDISDSELRSSGNRMPAILKQVDIIMDSGKIDMSLDKNLTVNQLEEETIKIEWVDSNPDKAESLFELEDHELLQGQIGIVGLEHPEYFQRFHSLFSCNKDAIDCALISIGNYGQREKNGWRYQLGSKNNVKAWKNLFHKSSNEGYERTKTVLADMLSRSSDFTDEYLANIKHEYIADCENKKSFDWRYYYIKYDVFRPGSFGKYNWEDFDKKPYEFSVMQTETQWSENTYQPFLKAVDTKNLSKDDYGQIISKGDYYIICENAAYVMKSRETNDEIKRLIITQNDKGIDTEDRIKKYQEWVQAD